MTGRDVAVAIEDLLRLPAKVEALTKEVAALRVEFEKLRALVPPQLVSVSEAARRLRVSEKTVRRYVQSGRLRSARIGASVRIDLAAVRELLELGPRF